MARFAALITAALITAACGSALSNKAQESMSNYKAGIDAQIAATR